MSKVTYQMESRNNRDRAIKEGITQEDFYGTNPMENTGVPLQGFKGVPVVDDHGQFGVAMPASDYKRDAQVPACAALTKKGEPCKAAPMSGQHLCVGHNRAVESE
jgi:hypothetical protein